MNRFKRIMTRGWLGRTLSIFTFGYYSFAEDIPIVHLTTAPRDFSLTTDARDLSLTASDRDFSLTTDSRDLSLTMTRSFNLTYSRD